MKYYGIAKEGAKQDKKWHICTRVSLKKDIRDKEEKEVRIYYNYRKDEDIVYNRYFYESRKYGSILEIEGEIKEENGRLIMISPTVKFLSEKQALLAKAEYWETFYMENFDTLSVVLYEARRALRVLKETREKLLRLDEEGKFPSYESELKILERSWEDVRTINKGNYYGVNCRPGGWYAAYHNYTDHIYLTWDENQ